MIYNLSNLYAQTDPRWGNEKLGLSAPADAILRLDGCAVTAIANLHNALFGSNFTPHDVNQMLIGKQGFVYDNHGYALLNWAAVPRIFPKLRYVAHDVGYNNPLVWSWINLFPKVPVIVEVQLQYSQHFILFVGDQLMVDSQDGKVKPTSTYPSRIATIRYARA